MSDWWTSSVLLAKKATFYYCKQDISVNTHSSTSTQHMAIKWPLLSEAAWDGAAFPHPQHTEVFLAAVPHAHSARCSPAVACGQTQFFMTNDSRSPYTSLRLGLVLFHSQWQISDDRYPLLVFTNRKTAWTVSCRCDLCETRRRQGCDRQLCRLRCLPNGGCSVHLGSQKVLTHSA